MHDVFGFDWDKGNIEKCQKHGVSLAEIEEIFQQDPLVLPDRTGTSESRLNAVGVTFGKMRLFVVFTLRESKDGNLIRPISARYMHRKEVDAYERAQRT